MPEDLRTAAQLETASEPILEAVGVSVRFGGLVALSDVSIAVPAGKLTGLVGPNGAGKSTLFGVCSGFVRPTQGTVRMLGREVTAASPQARARLGLARSFQQPEIFSSMSIAQHFALAHRLHYERRRLWTDLIDFRGWRPPDEFESNRVNELIELLGLESVAQRPGAGLPTGIARLVEVGRALAFSPRVLLLDEPASGLDQYEHDELALVLRRVADQENIAILLVEHDLEFVMKLCSTVYVLDFGVLIATGSPEEIRVNPAVQAAYLGSDPTQAMV